MTNYDILKEYEAHKTPVPTYEEWQELKELLLVCRKILEKETYDLMVKKIDNAIGEKK